MTQRLFISGLLSLTISTSVHTSSVFDLSDDEANPKKEPTESQQKVNFLSHNPETDTQLESANRNKLSASLTNFRPQTPTSSSIPIELNPEDTDLDRLVNAVADLGSPDYKEFLSKLEEQKNRRNIPPRRRVSPSQYLFNLRSLLEQAVLPLV